MIIRHGVLSECLHVLAGKNNQWRTAGIHRQRSICKLDLPSCGNRGYWNLKRNSLEESEEQLQSDSEDKNVFKCVCLCQFQECRDEYRVKTLIFFNNVLANKAFVGTLQQLGAGHRMTPPLSSSLEDSASKWLEALAN